MRLFFLKIKKFGELIYLAGIVPLWWLISLLGILAAGFFVRVYGIDFGLPYIYHPDEPMIAERVISMLKSGNLNPGWFGWPSLYMYMQLPVYVLRFFYGVSKGGSAIIESYRAGYYLWGRFTTACLGTLTVALTYTLGKKLLDRKTGILAALFLAFSYLHVSSSHYITDDVPVTFFVVLTVLVCFWIVEKGEIKFYLLAGLLAGFAVATKYTGGLVILCIFFAYIFRLMKGKKEYERILYSLITLVCGFLIGVPYAIKEMPTFLGNVAGEIYEYSTLGHLSQEGTENWWYYSKYLSREGLGRGIFILSMAGLVLAALKSTEKRFLSILFLITYFLWVSSSKVRFPRALMPILPFFSLCSAFFMASLWAWLAKRELFKKKRGLVNLIFILLIVALLFFPVINTWSFSHNLTKTDPRTLTKEWVESNIPKGAIIVDEAEVPLDKKNYNLRRLPLGEKRLNWYYDEGVEYLIASGKYHRFEEEWRKYPHIVANYNEIFREVELIKEIGFIRIYKPKPEPGQ